MSRNDIEYFCSWAIVVFFGLLFGMSTMVCKSGLHLEPEPAPVVHPVDGSAWCDAACQNLRRLPQGESDSCLVARDIELLDGGVETCEMACISNMANGVDWMPRCLSEIQSCEEIENKCQPN